MERAETPPNEEPKHTPTFKVIPQITPLPSKADNRESHPKVSSDKTQPHPNVRAENEDDDGYDPYSDFHDAPQKQPLFEASPWD